MQVPKDEALPCSTHPDAPHGFLRNASHEADQYVCECAYWKPPREWVGLTHKEMHDAVRPLCSDDEMAEWLLEESEDEYLAIEAKLKEKNYG